jgi:hypothetical protein
MMTSLRSWRLRPAKEGGGWAVKGPAFGCFDRADKNPKNRSKNSSFPTQKAITKLSQSLHIQAFTAIYISSQHAKMTTTTALVLALSTLALLSCAHARPHNASFGLLGGGRSMHMELVSGNSSVDVRLGKVYEQTANGIPVPGHRLPSLASLQPAVTNGELDV